MTTLESFDRPIAFHRGFVEITGSVTGALLLSQAIYWQNRLSRQSKDGWWFKTAEEFEEETGLGRRELESARKACSGILLHKVQGLPAVSWYKVDEAALQTSMAKTAKLSWRKAPNSDGGKRQTIGTETSSETSSESTHTESACVEDLQNRLYEMFRRPKSDRPNYCEISMICEIVRRVGWEGELDEIKHFKARLPASERRYFPQSVERLVCNWQPTLDRARVYEPNPQEQTLESRQADAFIRRMEKEL